MLERFRKQKRDAVLGADPADVPDQLEGVADSPSLGRDGIHHGPGRDGAPLRQPGGDAQQRTVSAGQGEQDVPVHDPLVRTVVVQQQPQEESRQGPFVRLRHRAPTLSNTTRCSVAFAALISSFVIVTEVRTHGKTVR